MYEELEVLFLVDIARFWSPSELRISGESTVHSGLRVDGEEFARVHADQGLQDDAGFRL